MAFPFKTGGDFYNCEALRMRLHNLGANPTETATGLMYFNTGASNLGKHAVVHDGTNFKALAFVDEIATNTAFTELADRVVTIEKALGEDTANVIDTWEEIQNFLKDINANDANLMTMLNSKLDKSGGTIEGTNTSPLIINTSATTEVGLRFNMNEKSVAWVGYTPNTGMYLYSYGTGSGTHKLGLSDAGVGFLDSNTLLHSGNYATEIGDYYLKSSGGTIEGGSDALKIKRAGSYLSSIGFYNSDSKLGSLGFVWGNAPAFFHTDGNYYLLLHSGNIGEYNAGGLAHSNGTVGAVVNSSGNVTIGASDLAGTSVKLYVDGKSTFRHAIHADRYNGQSNTAGAAVVINKGGDFFGIGPSASNVSNMSFGFVNDTSGTWIKEILTITTGNNILIGTPEDNGAKLQVKGDLYVEGNIIATKEVSAGGAGQEGESGAGGAEVISQQLASGQSTYTITNTIKRSDIAVSLYEWNANNGSWDMCLADISVKDATITVTFGSATSVNHKLVAVG